ncbi:MAG: ABC transporter permease [Bryobacterales bacterium]|nr:ABC transporter permease [Bryobacterales bacterium]
MNLRRIVTVTRKELKDAFRDRRQLVSILVASLASPLLIALLFNRIAEDRRGAEEIKVPVVGRQYAPVLLDWLGQQAGVQVVPGPADAEGAVRERKEDLVVVIPKDFAERFRDSKPAKVKLVSDSTSSRGRFKVERVRTLLQRYGAEIGGLRLIARGVSPVIASAVNVENVEVSSAQQRAAMILNMIPMLVMIAAFIAAMSIATDATAGERERGSLESLLINPVPRLELVTGKWLAAAISSCGCMLLTLVIVSTVVFRLPLQDLGVRFRFGVPEALLLMAAALPMSLVAPALQMYLSTFARSFKEAQGYVSYLMLLVTMPVVLHTFYPITGRTWTLAVPVIGQFALALDVISGKTPSPAALLAGLATAIATAAICLHLTRRLFERETIIFNR